MISDEKRAALARRMEALDIREEDLEESFVRGSGPGGQKVNKTASSVRLRHKPTGIEVKVQSSRSQATNRFLARRLLADRIERQRLGKKSQEQQRIEKIRRQKRRRSKRAKAKILADKQHRSTIKRLREPPDKE